MKDYVVNNIESVKEFPKDIHRVYKQEFHPDDDFRDFMDENGNRSFTDEQADYYNRVMTDSFQFCDDNGYDIYEVAGEVQEGLWKEQGLWPK